MVKDSNLYKAFILSTLFFMVMVMSFKVVLITWDPFWRKSAYSSSEGSYIWRQDQRFIAVKSMAHDTL